MIVSTLRFELTFTPRAVSPTGLSHTVVDWSIAVAVYGPLIWQSCRACLTRPQSLPVDWIQLEEVGCGRSLEYLVR